MVSRFEICADFAKCEPGGFEFAASVQLGLICVMAAFGIGARAESVNGQGAHLRPKFNHAHIGRAGDPVETFLSGGWAGVKGKDGAVATTDSRNRKARTRIIELLTL